MRLLNIKKKINKFIKKNNKALWFIGLYLVTVIGLGAFHIITSTILSPFK